MSAEKDIANSEAARELDASLHEDESRLAALYRKLPQTEPDAQLDARVRALAQRAVREQAAAVSASAPQSRPGSARWLSAFGAAAVVALAAGIAWRVGPTVWPSRNQPASISVNETPAGKPSPTADRDTARSTNAESYSTTGPATESAVAPVAKSVAPNFTPPPPPASAPVTPANSPVSPAPTTVAPKAASSAQALPSALGGATAQESTLRKMEKVENATSSAPPKMAAAPTQHVDQPSDTEQKQKVVGRMFAPPAPLSRADAPAQAPAAARDELQPQQSTSASSAGTTAMRCPRPPYAANWQGHYPPDIPPTPELRRNAVKAMLGQGHRDEARRAYADFRLLCPDDHWPPDLLNMLRLQ